MKKRKIVSSAIVGNIVEYYDFGIYAVFATNIGSLFFPSHDEFVQTLLALSVFAVGFLMRPVGGVLFGHIGDRIGRKVSLTLSIIGMAVCTLLIGILPGYNQIGVAAPILLVVVRLLQGICIGGEGAGSAIFILEHLEGYKPGLVGSIVMASNMIGTLLAAFVGIILNHFFIDDPNGWRYGFFLGSAMGLTGLYMRFFVSETPVFQLKKESNSTVKVPLLEVIAKQWKRLVVVAFLGGMTAAVAYMIRGYLNVFFQQIMNYEPNEALYFKSFALIVMIISLPFFGVLADKVGYRRFFYTVCYLIIVLIIPTFLLIANADHNVTEVLLGLLILGFLAAAICAPAFPYAISAFEPELRYSGMAFSWNMGIALFGGTTPAISTFLAEKIGHHAPAYYIIVMAIAFIIVTYATRKDKHSR
jgi:MHS family proline/betaine transporter-like MFS transporter